jgi:Protein of unknown function (DUF3592)
MNLHMLITAGIATLGIAIVGIAIFCTMECIHSLSWPSVEATILSSYVTKEFNDGTYYPVKVTYQYTVNGRSFVGERVKVGGEITHTWGWVAKRSVRKYPVGAVVRAYFSRLDPTIAVLEPGFNISLLLGIVIIGAVLLASSWHQFANVGL